MVYICGCIPACIKQALAELPDTLDETYERTLREINKADWEFAHRLFQFVAVAIRPLRVEELAELLAVDFKAGPIPKVHEGWRLSDPADVVLSKCSSLLVIVDGGSLPETADDGSFSEAGDSDDGSRSNSLDSLNASEIFDFDDTFFPEEADDGFRFGKVIQFSHYSVKEFLTSSRLAESTDNILHRYHVSMIPAHTLAAQACFGILLHLDEDLVTSDSLAKWPLAGYAARHWIYHVRFEDVSRNVVDGMKQLFDPRNPYLGICFRICNTDLSQRTLRDESPLTLQGTPLHFASHWGFDSIIDFLIKDRSQDVNSQNFDQNFTPLHLASIRGHAKVACMLIDRGADLTVQADEGKTPLHVASFLGRVEIARMLIDRGADLTAQAEDGETPFYLALKRGQADVARMLIERGADVKAQNKDGETPLHLASGWGRVEVVRMLIERGADVTAQNKDGETPLHLALNCGQAEVARMLIERGADVTAQNKDGVTPLHLVLKSPFLRAYPRIVATLLEHGADVNAKNMDGLTPLRLASQRGLLEITSILLEHGADPGEMSAPESPPVAPSPIHTHTGLSNSGHPSLTTPNLAVTDPQAQSPYSQPPSDDAPPECNREPVFFNRRLIFSLGIVAIAVAIPILMNLSRKR